MANVFYSIVTFFNVFLNFSWNVFLHLWSQQYITYHHPESFIFIIHKANRMQTEHIVSV